jgi:hypothetical protein
VEELPRSKKPITGFLRRTEREQAAPRAEARLVFFVQVAELGPSFSGLAVQAESGALPGFPCRLASVARAERSA